MEKLKGKINFNCDEQQPGNTPPPLRLLGSCCSGLLCSWSSFAPFSSAVDTNHPQWEKRACKMSAFFPQSAERQVGGGWSADSEQRQPPDPSARSTLSLKQFLLLFLWAINIAALTVSKKQCSV